MRYYYLFTLPLRFDEKFWACHPWRPGSAEDLIPPNQMTSRNLRNLLMERPKWIMKSQAISVMKLRPKLPKKVWKLRLIGNALCVNYRQIRPGMDRAMIRVPPFQLLDQEYLWKNLLGCLNNKCFVNPGADTWASMWTRLLNKTRTLIFSVWSISAGFSSFP